MIKAKRDNISKSAKKPVKKVTQKLRTVNINGVQFREIKKRG